MKQKLVAVLLTVATFGWIIAGQAAASPTPNVDLSQTTPPVFEDPIIPGPVPGPVPPAPMPRPGPGYGRMPIANGIRMLAKLDQKIAKLENKIDALKATIADIESNPAKFVDAEHVLAQLKATLAKVEGKLEAVKAKQEKIKAAVMEKMHQLYKQISGKIADIDQKIAAVKAGHMSDQAKEKLIGVLEGQKAALGKRLEVLEQLGKAVNEGEYKLALHILQESWKNPGIGPKPEKPPIALPVAPGPGSPSEPDPADPVIGPEPIIGIMGPGGPSLDDNPVPLPTPVAPEPVAPPVIGPAPGPEPGPVIGPAPGDVVIAPNSEKSLQTNNYPMNAGSSNRRKR